MLLLTHLDDLQEDRVMELLDHADVAWLLLRYLTTQACAGGVCVCCVVLCCVCVCVMFVCVVCVVFDARLRCLSVRFFAKVCHNSLLVCL